MRPHSAPPDLASARALLASARGAVAAGDAPAALRAVVAAARTLGVPLTQPPPPGDAGALADLLAACSLRVSEHGGGGGDEAMAVDGASTRSPPSLLAERGAEADAAAAEGASVACPACGGVVAAARMDAHVRLWCQAGEGGGGGG